MSAGEPKPNAPLYIPSLDGLRALSILIVFLSHAGLSHVIPGPFGVAIFFFLSGYLITTLMRQERERTGSVNLWHFYLRRTLRIFPPLYLILAFTWLLVATGLLRGVIHGPAILA